MIIVALTALASFTIPNESFASAYRLLKFFLIIVSAIWGLYGFILGIVVIGIHLSGLTSYGIPYMTPAVSMPDGRTRRFRMEEFPLLADELLAVLFESLGTTGMPKDTLMAFAMTSGSLCAMRTLMQFYPLSSAEKALLERILRENAPQVSAASPNQPLF